MIERVQFRNFKAYRSLDLELEPFTVLVGPNASGKTTVLEGLHLASVLARQLLEGGRSFAEGPLVQSHGITAPVELHLFGRWEDKAASVQAVSASEIVRAEERTPAHLPFMLKGDWNGEKIWAGDWPEARKLHKFGVLGGYNITPESLAPLRAALSSTSILRFEPRRLAEASYSEDPVPVLDSDGSGLASVLAYLKLSQDEVFNDIEVTLKQIVPAVKRIRIERAIVEQNSRGTLWGNRLVFDMRGAKGVPADAAGEGTLMALGLLTVLKGPTHPRLVLLDDIELSLHPAAQSRLIQVLRDIQKADPGLQFVATSHSPFILNDLDPNEVRMTFLAEENGFAHCEKLTAHPEFERWKGMMAPGEFWSTVGEAWIEKKAGGAPAHE